MPLDTDAGFVKSGGRIWQPDRALGSIDRFSDQIQKLQNKVQPPVNPSLVLPFIPGAPENLSSLSATESPAKQQDRTYSEVSVSFTITPSATYSRTRIWITGYKGNPNPVLQTEGASGPINFLLETTNEMITVTGQPVSSDGTVIDLSSCLTTTVKLDGVISAPPAPTISQTLVAIPVGLQFAYNQVNVGSTQDVIDSYRIYRNTSANTFAGAALLRVNKHDPTSSNAVVVQDVIGGGLTYYYFVTAVNTVGLESTSVAAQAAPVTSGTANLDTDVSNGSSFIKMTPAQGTGATSAANNINSSDGTYATIPYHGSAFRRVIATSRSGVDSSNSGAFVTVASYVLQIPSNFTKYLGNLAISKGGTATVWTIQGRLKIGSLFSNVLSTTNAGTISVNGTVTVTGITPGTQITVEVQALTTTGSGTISCTSTFTQNEYQDQDTTNLQ